MKPRILFYVLHLLGVGHVHRAKRLVEGMHSCGFDVDIVYGGMPLSIDFSPADVFMLPAIAAGDATFQSYVDEHGDSLTPEYMNRRGEILLSHFSQLNPDIILLEAFPFGRRVVKDELIQLLESARSRSCPPIIATSVRDILESRKNPKRYEETKNLITKYIDHILVHSDSNIIALDSTYPLAHDISDKITYTGFVVDDSPAADELLQPYDIIVSVGGGAFGFELLHTASQVARLPQWSDYHWCFATGPNMADEKIQELKNSISSNVCLVCHLDNFAAHLRRARMSISQCGYNTAMDVLTAPQCQSIFVPYDTQGQSEQTRRSELLATAGLSVHLPHSQLSSHSLLDSLEQASRLSSSSRAPIDFSGVMNSAQFLSSLLPRNHE